MWMLWAGLIASGALWLLASARSRRGRRPDVRDLGAVSEEWRAEIRAKADME